MLRVQGGSNVARLSMNFVVAGVLNSFRRDLFIKRDCCRVTYKDGDDQRNGCRGVRQDELQLRLQAVSTSQMDY